MIEQPTIALKHLEQQAQVAFRVLPLPVLPFSPEQSVRHYAFHVRYAASKLPSLVVLSPRRAAT